MLEFFIFILGLLLIFWIASVNNRVTVLENKLKDIKALGQSPTEPSANRNKLFDQAQNSVVPSPEPNITQSPQVLANVSAHEEAENAAGWLSKIGVLAVVLGIGFFIKFAIDQGWINEWTRVLLGLAVGVMLCVLGSVWKEKYKDYSAVLAGGGLAVMYFSVYSAYQFYNLVPQPVAVVLMIAVSAFGGYVSYGRKSLSFATISILGAYLSPVVMWSGTDQYIPLFVYLGILNILAVSILLQKYWSELLVLSFIGSALDFSVWGMHFLNQSNSFTAAFFAAFMFLLLTIGGAVAMKKSGTANLPKDAGKNFAVLTILLGLFYVMALYFVLYSHFHDYLAIMALLGSVGAFLAYAIVDRLEISEANHALAFVGTALLSLACIWQFSGKVIDFMIIALGLALSLAGAALKRKELKIWGLLTLVGCVFAVLFESYDMKNYIFILNSKFGLVLAETFALWFTGWLYKAVPLEGEQNQASEIAHVIGSLLLWFGFSVELNVYFTRVDLMSIGNLTLSLWWIAYATALIIFGAVTKSSIYKKIALAIYVLAILKVFLYDSLTLDTAYRIVSFIVLGVILLSVSYFYQKNREKITKFLDNRDQV